MEKKSFKLAELTANLKVYDIKSFDAYLKEIWIDLISRITKNENDKINNKKRQDLIGLTKLIFTKYYSLPGIIGDRLFRVFDSNANDVLELSEFKTGMNILFSGDYEKTLRFIFDFYDFDGDGKISKEDIRVVLSYVTYSNETEIEKSQNISINESKNERMKKQLYESSVKNQNQLIDILEKCFKNEGDLIDFISFTKIIENINSDIYFMIYIFLLQKRPFSFKSIQLYQNIFMNIQTSFSEINLDLKAVNRYDNLSSKNNTVIISPFNRNKNFGLMNNSNSIMNKNINFSIKEYEHFKNNLFKENEINTSQNLFDDDDNNYDKTFFEVKLSKDLIDAIDNAKYEEEEDEEKNELYGSEDNEYEGYIYKLNNGKMIKIWFKLFYKDLFYYKKKDDIRHRGMHNLSGLFFKEEPTKIVNNIPFYSFSILFPTKTRTYFCDNNSEYEHWVKSLKIATNYSNILEIYKISEVLGSGSFSLVKLAINQVTKQKVAVKIMDKKRMNSSRLESARTEIEIMKICQHPNIIHFIDSYENEDFIYIFMEYCEGGTFFEFLKKRNFILKEELAVSIVHKMCMAVYYFHSYGITHRDLKPENILMTSKKDDADIRILDFGLGKIIGPNEKCSEPYGTIIYCAPEIILDYPYTKNVDSWSLGIITYIILYGRLPFWDKDRPKLSSKITKANPVYKPYGNIHISEEAKNFIQNLLIKDQYKRMSIKQALEHKWFQKYNKDFVKFRCLNKDKKNIFELYTSLYNNKGKNSHKQ
jgi:calcium/calmodulin-dependent protein kinase I